MWVFKPLGTSTGVRTSHCLYRGYSVLTWAPAASGGATMQYVLQESDVVCFRSAPSDGFGHHSLINTGGSGYTMPPQASVGGRARAAAGRVGGQRPRRAR